MAGDDIEELKMQNLDTNELFEAIAQKSPNGKFTIQNAQKLLAPNFSLDDDSELKELEESQSFINKITFNKFACKIVASSQSEQVDEDSRIDYVADEESLSEHPPHRRQTSTRFYDDLSQDSFLDVEKFKGALKTYGAADTLIQCFDSNKFSYTDLNVLQMAFTE